MRLQNAFLARHQIVGIIFHQRSSLRVLDVRSHQFHHANHRRYFPVAFGAETVALLHQSLDGKARQLFETAQHIEMRHYRMIVILCKEFLDTDLLLCLHCHMPSEFVGIPAVVDDLISAVILFHQRIHFALRNRIHIFHHIIDTVMVNLPAELDLRFHLVAFGDRYIVHVVAETAYTDMRRFDHTQRRSHPAAQLF